MSHLSADDEAIEKFIKLDLNRNLALVIDSDRDSESAPLKPAPQRLMDEMSKDNGLVWITEGREIENYIDPNALQAALKMRHSTIYKGPDKVGKYDHAFYFRRKKYKASEAGLYTNGDKVGAALRICEQQAELDIYDLNTRINELATMIRSANGLLPIS